MKKLSCLFNHRHKKLKDVRIEDFENEDKEIKTFTCKDCGKEITFIVEYVKGKFLNSHKEVTK